ncbi:MAG: GNAT family N-acetyltransferase [Candidatus Eisenbacteria bacterium]
MTDRPITLREITRDTVRAICRLEVAPAQRNFVAPNAISISEAHFAPEAWFRAIHAADEPVGFVMLSLKPAVPEFYLWRFMIAAPFQRRGYGAAALALAVEHVRTLGAKDLLTSTVPGDGSPRPFYESLGFVATGLVDDGEEVLRLELTETAAR